MIYADLHVHTNHSDGICEISEIMKMAVKGGIKAIAITDHDTVNQFDEIKNYGNSMGIEVVKGVEMSCYDFDVFKKVHIVGLWINEKTPHIKELCDKTLRCRDQFHRELIGQLVKKGYKITYEDAKRYSKYNIVFKMNIFQALKNEYPFEMDEKKYKELFASKTSKETDLKMGYIPVKEGIKAIKEDGGISIIAHPCEYDNYSQIEKYVGYGLQGIEISHPEMREIDYKKTMDFAVKYSLAKSGGSDFHDPAAACFGRFGLTKQQYEELKYFPR